MSKTKLIGVLFDVSASMIEPYNDISKNEYSLESKSHSLIGVLTNLTKNLKIDIFAFLFGSNDGTIIDFLLLVKNVISFLSNLKYDFANPKEEFIRIMDQYESPTNLSQYIYNEFGPTDEELSFACGLIHQNNDLGNKIYSHLPDIVKPKIPGINFLINYGVDGYNKASHGLSKFTNFLDGKGFKPSESKVDKEVIEQIKLSLEDCVSDIIDNIFEDMKKDNKYIKEKYMILDSTKLEKMLEEMNNLIEKKFQLEQKKIILWI